MGAPAEKWAWASPVVWGALGPVIQLGILSPTWGGELDEPDFDENVRRGAFLPYHPNDSESAKRGISPIRATKMTQTPLNSLHHLHIDRHGQLCTDIGRVGRDGDGFNLDGVGRMNGSTAISPLPAVSAQARVLIQGELVLGRRHGSREAGKRFEEEA
ncbi:hypothetical protein C8R45DRAFT_1105833 [Mycena sanguinolenta]|nr:hypothetical protein C8R45DRAFT_1105833 [Mycena sanguinolenta]